MSWQEIAEETQYMVALAPQTTDVNTAGSSWEWIECAVFTPENESTQVDTPRGAETFAAWQSPIPGKTFHRLALKGPVKGQIGAFAFASTTPDLYGLSRFLHFLGGSDALAYQATGVEATGSDGDTIVLKTTSAAYGGLIAARDTDNGLVNMGFGKSYTGTGPWTWTIRDNMAAVPDDDGGRLATLTQWPARAALTNLAYTVRIVFADVNQDRRYIGFIPHQMRLMVEDDVLMWEVNGVAYGGEVYDGEEGTLETPLTSLLAMQPATSSTRYMFDGGSQAAGTADPTGSCGVRDVVLTIDWGEPLIARGGSLGDYAQGVCDVTMRAPTITCDLAVPTISDYENNSKNALLDAYERKVGISMAAYHGNEAGKLLAWSMASARPTARPQRRFIDGVEHFACTLRAGPYTGDGGPSDGGNKPLDIGVG